MKNETWLLWYKNINKYNEYNKFNGIKNEKLESDYISFLYVKEIKTVKVLKMDVKGESIHKLNEEYKKYHIKKELNWNKEKNNKFIYKRLYNEKIEIANNKYIKNNVKNKYLDQKHRLIGVFNKLSSMLNKKKNISIIKNYKLHNIVEDHINNIDNRQIKNNLLKPHYFFTVGYNEGPLPTQIRQWTSSVYYFLKLDKINTTYLDNYTSKLIKLFFNVKYLRKRLTWDLKITNGFKIVPDLYFYKNINNILSYTSRRTNLSLREAISFTPAFLKLDVIKEQMESAIKYGKLFKQRKLKLYLGFYPKRKTYFRKLSRIILSKPFFKHTTLNLIIDLFLYNNKRFKFKRIKNLTLRRSIYKYMYSMYADYIKKIKDTINRPRFFYINLIEPKIYNSYSDIITTYYKYFIYYKNPVFVYFSFLSIQLNLIFKFAQDKIFKNDNVVNKNNIINNNIVESNKSSFFNINTIFYNKNNTNKGKFFIYKNKQGLSIINNEDNNIIIYNKNKLRAYYIKQKNIEVDKKKNKSEGEDFSKYVLIRKYLAELESKSNKPIDMSTLTLWNTKGLNNKWYTPTGLVLSDKLKKKLKKFSNKKSYRKTKENAKKLQDPRAIFIKDKEIYNKRKGNKKRNILAKKNIIIKYGLTDSKRVWRFETGVLLPVEVYQPDKFDWLKHVLLPDEKLKKSLIVPQIKSTNISNNITNNLTKSNNYLDINNNSNINNTNNIINNNIKSNIDNINFNNLNNNIYDELPKNIDNINNSYIINKNNNFILKNNINNYDQINKKENLYYYLTNNRIINYNINSIKSKRKDSIINKNNIFFNKSIGYKNKFDHSILNLNLFSKFINNKGMSSIKGSQFNFYYDELKKLIGSRNIWLVYNILANIEKEYSKIYNDVIMSKDYVVLPYSYNNTESYEYNGYSDQYIDSINHENSNKVEFKVWPSFDSNYNNEIIKKGYNEKLFKVRYRNLINYSIILYYYKIIYYWNKLNFNFLNINMQGNNNIDYKLYKFSTVNIIFDLLHYNYRSLIRIKPRYYFINKFRLYEYKYRKANFNNWIVSMRFVKKLRRTPKNFWYRLNILSNTFYNKIIRFAELDTKRSVLVPFVLYIEDILYTLYGKWVLIRIWPLKRYFLSSYLLAGRFLTLMLWRKKKKSGKFNFQRMSTKLISGIRILQIRKAYQYYNEYSARWPNKLINLLSNNKLGKYNYGMMEWYDEDNLKNYQLESYNIPYNNLNEFFSNNKYNYIFAFNKTINAIRRFKIKKNIWRNRINNLQYMNYWLRPLKHYIMTLNKGFDITGLQLRLSGRLGTTRNNLRSTYKNRIYGSLLGPNHLNIRSGKNITIGSPKLRGYLKPNVDFAIKISKTKNGAVSLKVWMSSIFSSDLRELLLHLVKIKSLYSQLINRFYFVKPYVNYIKNNYNIESPYKSLDINILKKRKRKVWRRKKYFKKSFKFIKNPLNKKSLPFKKYTFIKK